MRDRMDSKLNDWRPITSAESMIAEITPAARQLAARYSKFEAIDPDDLIQETMLRMLSAPKLGVDNFKAYAHSVLANTAISWLRASESRACMIAAYAEIVLETSEPSCAREVEIADSFERELGAKDRHVAELLLGHERREGPSIELLASHGYAKNSRSQLRARILELVL